MSVPEPNFEERKFELDAEIRRRELALKEAEARRGSLTAAQATVAGALLALCSGLAGALIAAWSSHSIEAGKSLTSVQIEELKTRGNLDLEKSKQTATVALEQKKFETSLIIEAIKTSSRVDAIRNLKFFVSAGFISDPDGRIAKLSDDSLPSIAAPSTASSNRAIRSTGLIVSARGTVCTGVAISSRFVMTANFCVDASSKLLFRKGDKDIPVSVMSANPTAKIVLLRAETEIPIDSFLNHSRIREPVAGERAYIAVPSFQESTVNVKLCQIQVSAIALGNFKHNCDGGPGSAGSIIIAVSDDALLGLHHSMEKDGVGEATKILQIVKILSSLPDIEAVDQGR